VAATIEMGRALDMTVVAEGVETREQLDNLRELGCDLAQGYYFARPVPAAAVTELLRDGFAGSGVPEPLLCTLPVGDP
jgi:EAL domain-containing protein (putative c-di-GMP-specific phosphodiesterase class I)